MTYKAELRRDNGSESYPVVSTSSNCFGMLDPSQSGYFRQEARRQKRRASALDRKVQKHLMLQTAHL